MKLSFRWYGENDKVTLQNIRQIPGMYSIVTAVYDVPVGDVWSRESIQKLKKQTEDEGLHFDVIESGLFMKILSLEKQQEISILRTIVKISEDLVKPE
jgi:D-mannonate dehydratase